MPTFHYIATDAEGGKHAGRLEAEDVRAARKMLEARGFAIERLDEVLEAAPASEPRGPRLSQREAAELVGHVGEVTRSGLPLAAGLRYLAEGLPDGRVGQALVALAARLEAGATTEAALESLGDRFPAHLRGLIAAGARTGRLGEVLVKFAQQQETERELWRGVWAATAYPLLVLAFLGILMLAMLWILVPDFAGLFADFELELPPRAVFVIWLSEQGSYWLLGIAALAAAVVLAARILFGRIVIDWVASSIPLFGPLWTSIRLAELSRMLEILIQYGVPLPEAFRLAAEGMSDTRLGSACRKLSAVAAGGSSVSQCIATSRTFPAMLARLVAWGEESRSLPEAFAVAGEVFEDFARLRAELLKRIFPPLVFLITAWSILVLIVGVTSPLVELTTSLI